MSSPASNIVSCLFLALLASNDAMCACPIVSRAMWGARPARTTEDLALPAPYVVIHHTYIPAACNSSEQCTAALKHIQDMHQITNGWSDIGYNFCVGGDGQVYEGRGWDRVGAHAPKYNFMSIGICLIGDYRSELPSNEMLDAVKSLIDCGVARGSLAAKYKLIGHNQVRETECPGGKLSEEIKTWPHWQPITDIQPRASTTSAPITESLASLTAAVPITEVPLTISNDVLTINLQEKSITEETLSTNTID